MDLITAVKNTASLKKVIEEDMASHFINLQFYAASNALAGLGVSKDKKSVYWSAINHLETTQQELVSKLKSPERYLVAKQYLYISALKASIYKYLDEEGLMMKCFDDSLNVVKNQWAIGTKQHFSDYLNKSWNPVYQLAENRIRNSALYKAAKTFDVNSFWQNIAHKTESLVLPITHSYFFISEVFPE